jgi:hypothetical protein
VAGNKIVVSNDKGDAMRCMMVVLLGAALAHGRLYASDAYDARAQRAARERAVNKAGPVARNFVESYGTHAVAAIMACSPAAGARLAKLHESGGLRLLPDPAKLLDALAECRGGDEAVDFVIAHHKELQDNWRFRAFVADPLTYSLSLMTLDEGAASRKWLIESVQQQMADFQQERETKAKESMIERETKAKESMIQLCVGGGSALVLVLWLVRARRNRFG